VRKNKQGDIAEVTSIQYVKAITQRRTTDDILYTNSEYDIPVTMCQTSAESGV
jgi:hypothetical protein